MHLSPAAAAKQDAARKGTRPAQRDYTPAGPVTVLHATGDVEVTRSYTTRELADIVREGKRRRRN